MNEPVSKPPPPDLLWHGSDVVTGTPVTFCDDVTIDVIDDDVNCDDVVLADVGVTDTDVLVTIAKHIQLHLS